MKRLRKRIGSKVRFYAGGEYGEQGTIRPHFHACLFGYDFPDKVFYKNTSSGERIYTSKLLESLWNCPVDSALVAAWRDPGSGLCDAFMRLPCTIEMPLSRLPTMIPTCPRAVL